MVKTPPLHELHWKRAWRLIPTRHFRVNLYERLVDSREQHHLVKLEEMTNARVRLEKNEIVRLREGDFFRRHASRNITASFAHKSRSRFGNGHNPALYAASSEATAVAEKEFHEAERLRLNQIPAMPSQQRALLLNITGTFHDLRGLQSQFKAEYSPTSYSASQSLGWHLWKEGSAGLVYDSLRYRTGDCIAVFSPQTIKECRLGPLYEFHWDGKTITETYRLNPTS